MEHDQALQALQSESSHERLQGARALLTLARPDDRDALARALRNENDGYTKTALRQALRAIVEPTPLIVAAPTSDGDDLIYSDIYAKAVEETSARVVHELRRLIGRVKVTARSEWDKWESSATRREIARLDSLMDAIDRLGRAASVPQLAEFDLASMIRRAIRPEVERGTQIQTVGREPLIVVGDEVLVDLALQNAVRNAVEAVKDAGAFDAIIVSWGDTDRDYWITVADRGLGLPPRQDLFQLGVTTKDRTAHAGVGLAIARQAVQSLGGTLTLTNREDGGVLFELRWPR